MNQKEIKVGDIVKYIGNKHDIEPEYYPFVGTIGVVKSIDFPSVEVEWERGSTSGDDCWYCGYNAVEVVNSALESEERMTNEEIWEMLKPKMSKNGLKPSKVVKVNFEDDCNTDSIFTVPTTYYESDVINAIAIAYRSGYLRAMKGRPFKFNEKKEKKKSGHWVPVDPNNLPKEGTKVRYSRESKEYSIEKEPMIAIGDIGEFSYGKILGLPGIRFDDGRFWNWVSFSNEPECLDMWVEDDE